MCTFCVQHGDGKRWYANAKNYAFDLESDLRRRGFMVDFVRNFERTRRSVDVGLAALRYLPRPLEKAVTDRVTRSQQREHFGQPIPLEECARIFDRATNITRLPCVCRGAMKAGSDAESCCIVMTVASHDGTLAEAFRDYTGGPGAQGFEKLTKSQALALLRRAEAAGLAHTAWTFLTPFVAAICNCNLPSGCLFQRRCPYAMPICSTVPPLQEIAPGQISMCWLTPDFKPPAVGADAPAQIAEEAAAALSVAK